MILGKRIIFALLIAAGVWFLCFGSRPREDVPKDFVVVEYWEKWVGTEADDMRQIVDDFNQTVGQQKHIHVRYLSMSKLDQKLLIATAAGVPPDIAGLFDPQVAEFASLGALEPLDELAAAHGIDENTYQPGYWKACHYQGRLWALISTPACVALFYNKRIFRENAAVLRAAGLDPDRPPRTLPELDRYAAALNVIDADGHIRRAGYLPMEPGWYIDFTWCWFGGELFDEKTGRFTLDSPRNVAAFQWMADYSKRLRPDAMVEFHDAAGGFDSPQNAFLTGEVAMEQQGPWMANFINRLTRQEPWAPSMSEAKVPRERESELKDRRDNYDWAAAPFPSAVPGEQNVSYCSCDNLVIPHGARHVEAAFEFLAYVTRQDVMEKLNTLHCKSSPLRKVSTEFLANHPNPYIQVFNDLAASPNARFAPQVPMWGEVKKTLDDATQSVCLLDKKPATALREAQDRLQAELDRQLRIDAARRALSP
jgi:ABC-type glycerol-3-phosphate transport system substrate-binding protein